MTIISIISYNFGLKSQSGWIKKNPVSTFSDNNDTRAITQLSIGAATNKIPKADTHWPFFLNNNILVAKIRIAKARKINRFMCKITYDN